MNQDNQERVNTAQLKQEINDIKERNKKVECDKAWETSWSRRIALACLTYGMIALFFLMTGFDRPYSSALVPTAGFLLSTLSLSLLKKWWIKNRK